MTMDSSPITLQLLERLRDDMRARLPVPAAAAHSAWRRSASLAAPTKLVSKLTSAVAMIVTALISLAELRTGI